MLFVIITLIVASIGLIIKFRQRLAFRHGRLSRPYDDQTSTTPLTKMGTDQFIELSFGKVHYIYRPSTRSSSRLNIFVHGFSIPMEIWQDVFQSLVNDNHSCLVFDLYGRGWSDAPFVRMNVDLFVSQLAELLYALNLPYEKYHLFGVSMGGVIVQRFTEIYPSKVSKLVLCCSAGLNVVQPTMILMYILSIPILGPMLFKLVMQRGDNKSVRSQWAYPDADEYRKYMKLFQETCKQHPGYLRSLFSTIFHFNFQSASKSVEFIEKLKIPILIIWGDKDSLIPVENAYRYHKLYKNSSLTIVPGANHSILIEHSEPVIDAIKTFLRDT
jgi:pimeloyl-ACP methyl ester carboxylesterase